MKNYPIFLNLKNRKALVFGGGEVALRKIKTLLECGARIEVASRDYSEEILKLARKNSQLTVIPAPDSGIRGQAAAGIHTLGPRLKHSGATKGVNSGMALVFAATSDRVFNKRIAAECRRKGIWVNVADDPKLCDFFVPSSLKKGKLEIAISTGGASPLLARKFREELAGKIRPEAVRLLGRMEKFRRKAFQKISFQKDRKNYFEMKAGGNFLK